VVDLKFDALGIIIFLWFIFRGLQNSKVAKRKSEDRRRSEPWSKNTVRPLVKEQESREVRREARPEPKAEPMSMPSWFPFPLEIPGGDVVKETKRQINAKSKSVFNEDKVEKSPVKQMPKVREMTAPTVIEIQESQWQAKGQSIALDKTSVINGMIWSEVLGPPRSKKKFNYR